MSKTAQTIGIQGDLGSNHHLLVTRMFPTIREQDIFCAKTFMQLSDALANKQIDSALMAIENSIAGSIHSNFDLLSKHDFSVIGEGFLPIRHQLIGIPQSSLEKITVVYSHPMALAQCETFIQTHGIEAREYFDTAAAVPFVQKQNDPTVAAIAPSLAAVIHAMPILAADIQDTAVNTTRFLLLSRDKKEEHSGREKKVLLEFTLPHTEGSLLRVLALLATAHANLTKIESRPIPTHPWEYKFYTDFVVNASDLEIQNLVRDIRNVTTTLRVHGIFIPGKEYSL